MSHYAGNVEDSRFTEPWCYGWSWRSYTVSHHVADARVVTALRLENRYKRPSFQDFELSEENYFRSLTALSHLHRPEKASKPCKTSRNLHWDAIKWWSWWPRHRLQRNPRRRTFGNSWRSWRWWDSRRWRKRWGRRWRIKGRGGRNRSKWPIIRIRN